MLFEVRLELGPCQTAVLIIYVDHVEQTSLIARITPQDGRFWPFPSLRRSSQNLGKEIQWGYLSLQLKGVCKLIRSRLTHNSCP